MASHASCPRLFVYICIFSLLNLGNVESRKHKLQLKNDFRNYFQLSSFGFFEDGSLEVHVENLQFSPFNASSVFGFSLDRTSNDAISPYLESHQDRCVLEDTRHDLEAMSVVFFTLDVANKQLKISCSESMKHLRIQTIASPTDATRTQRAVLDKPDKLSDSFLLHRRRRREPEPENKVTTERTTTKIDSSPVDKTVSSAGDHQKSTDAKKNLASPDSVSKTGTMNKEATLSSPTGKSAIDVTTIVNPEPGEVAVTFDREQNRREQLGLECGELKSIPATQLAEGKYEFGFIVRVVDAEDEGLYNLYFHNCPNYRRFSTPEVYTTVNLTVDIVEMNDENYLSAGQMPLPAVYFFMSLLFFLSGCFWTHNLRKSSAADVYKIHYLMALLVYVKSFSLAFHGINFHFIQSFGFHIEGWAVLYYITHLLKGALLFITIVLIGTGWALIKHIISDKEKKIFMIVIPLQVLANVAEIIMEESEEGDSAHNAWREVFILVDLLCCGAILFPVVWSIRHLQEASQTDGKAAINLKKLKLFRHFYIMIVCYIYFTRIIVYLLRITVPFKYEWLDELFREVATLVFFVLTGYKFRPASNNPYLQLPQDDSEIEMDVVITQSGAMEGVTKVGRNKVIESTKAQKQESSHEYD